MPSGEACVPFLETRRTEDAEFLRRGIHCAAGSQFAVITLTSPTPVTLQQRYIKIFNQPFYGFYILSGGSVNLRLAIGHARPDDVDTIAGITGREVRFEIPSQELWARFNTSSISAVLIIYLRPGVIFRDQDVNIAGSIELDVDITRVGGTTQTGIDYYGLWRVRSLDAPETATVGTTSAQIVASLVTRRFLYIRNTSTGGQRISLGFGTAAAVLDSGITLAVNDSITFDVITGLPTAAVNAISSAAGGTVGIQRGT